MGIETAVDTLIERLNGMSEPERQREIASWTNGLAARVLDIDPNASDDDFQQTLDEMIRCFRAGMQREHCRRTHRLHQQAGTA